MAGWGRFSGVVGVCLALMVAPSRAQQPDAGIADEPRTALVIGNAAYPSMPLRNSVNDARDMAAKLKQLGFHVTLLENAGNREMTRAIGAFGLAIAKGGVGLFYYSGHGLQVYGRNFLVPVDADIESESTVPTEAVEANSVLEQMDNAKNRLNIVILDACRNNPFERRFRGIEGGLAQSDAPAGSLIDYATAPGKVASDGAGKNGLYTGELLRALDEPGLKIEDVFKRVRARVSAATAMQQVPWESSSLTGDFYFRAPTASEVATSAPTGGGGDEAERLFWDSIKDSKNPADYRAYLEAFPTGTFAPLARARAQATDTASSRPSATPTAAAPAPAETGQVAALPPTNGALTGAQIRAVLAGNSITGVEAGQPYTEFYLANGKIKGVSQDEHYDGKWRIDGNRLCLDYEGTDDDGCWTIVMDGDKVLAYDSEGDESGNQARLKPGNPAGL